MSAGQFRGHCLHLLLIIFLFLVMLTSDDTPDLLVMDGPGGSFDAMLKSAASQVPPPLYPGTSTSATPFQFASLTPAASPAPPVRSPSYGAGMVMVGVGVDGKGRHLRQCNHIYRGVAKVWTHLENIMFLWPQRAREGLVRQARPLSACTAY